MLLQVGPGAMLTTLVAFFARLPALLQYFPLLWLVFQIPSWPGRWCALLFPVLLITGVSFRMAGIPGWQ